jgi:hypothetical protein
VALESVRLAQREFSTSLPKGSDSPIQALDRGDGDADCCAAFAAATHAVPSCTTCICCKRIAEFCPGFALKMFSDHACIASCLETEGACSQSGPPEYRRGVTG